MILIATLRMFSFFFFNDTATTEIYTLSLHDALPILPCAQLFSPGASTPRPHASHKGSFGDVAILGGEGLGQRGLSMTGAAWLAALAALHGGAGRVMLALLDASAGSGQATAPWPEIG